MSKFIAKLAQPKLLIGEGVEEERLFKELIKKLEISNISIAFYGGKNNLGNYLKTLPLIAGFDNLTSLGITRDADESKERAYQSIFTALKNNNLPLPNSGDNTRETLPRISIFILPDNKNPGMLEDLCLQSVDDDPGMSCLEEYFNCIQKNTNRQPKNLAKAKIHAWLASQNEPDKRLAEAAKAGYWNWESPAFEPLKKFILSL